MWTPKLNQLAYQCIEVSGLPGDQLALADPTNSPLDPRTREVEGQRETPLPEPVRPTRTSKPGGSTTKGRSSGFGKRLGSGSQTHRVEGFWRARPRPGPGRGAGAAGTGSPNVEATPAWILAIDVIPEQQ